MDGVVVVGGCDKNMLGGMIVFVCLNVLGIYVYGGMICLGNWKGCDLMIVLLFEVVGEFIVGWML